METELASAFETWCSGRSCATGTGASRSRRWWPLRQRGRNLRSRAESPPTPSTTVAAGPRRHGRSPSPRRPWSARRRSVAAPTASARSAPGRYAPSPPTGRTEQGVGLCRARSTGVQEQPPAFGVVPESGQRGLRVLVGTLGRRNEDSRSPTLPLRPRPTTVARRPSHLPSARRRAAASLPKRAEDLDRLDVGITRDATQPARTASRRASSACSSASSPRTPSRASQTATARCLAKPVCGSASSAPAARMASRAGRQSKVIAATW